MLKPYERKGTLPYEENSGIDWNAVAGNIFGNVFGDALKILAEMNNDKKENDDNE